MGFWNNMNSAIFGTRSAFVCVRPIIDREAKDLSPWSLFVVFLSSGSASLSDSGLIHTTYSIKNH